MKSIKFILFVLPLGFMLSCGTENNSENPATHALMTQGQETDSLNVMDFLQEEDTLRFGVDNSCNIYRFTKLQLEEGLANFGQNYTYGKKRNKIINDVQQLSISQVKKLIDVVIGESSYNPAEGYAALRMYFALDKNRMLLLYEPVIFKKTLTADSCVIAGTGVYGIITPDDTLKFIKQSELDAYTKHYRDSINIKHKHTQSMAFIDSPDFNLGDIKSVVLPFQQLLAMYADNVAASQEQQWSDKINFSVVANNNYKNSSNYKMHVVAHYNLADSTTSGGAIFKNFAADYAQMCPPVCNVVWVNYYNRNDTTCVATEAPAKVNMGNN